MCSVRRHERLPLEVPIILTYEDAARGMQYVRGRSLDISASGMRVEVPHSIPLRSYVTVNSQKVSLAVNASVRHSVANRGKYLLGLEFNCPMKALAERLAKETAAKTASLEAQK